MEDDRFRVVASAQAGRFRTNLFWAAILALALAELAGHAAIRASIPSPRDWQNAAAHVRRHFRAGDAVTAAPAWADPVLRRVLGDRISLSVAGRSDLAANDRLWALAIRDARPADAPRREADFEQRFGSVDLLRWDLSPSTVLADLVKEASSARVAVVQGGVERPCPLRSLSPGDGGGLGRGVLPPAERFVCKDGRDAYWLAPVVLEDLALQPRYCLWQPPLGRDPVRIEFSDLPLGDRLVFYGGLYYEHERDLGGEPVRIAVLVNGQPAGVMIHRDGDGWKRLEVSTRNHSRRSATGKIAVEVTGADPRRRGFCWAATTRRESREERP